MYLAKCAACHGPTGTEGPRDKLVGENLPVKTIGTFWPYATTVFDYIRRAQPFDKPGSLTDDEVYAVSAWLLFKNQTIPADQVIDADTLPKVRMPNRDGFVPDPRPDVDEGSPANGPLRRPRLPRCQPGDEGVAPRHTLPCRRDPGGVAVPWCLGPIQVRPPTLPARLSPPASRSCPTPR